MMPRPPHKRSTRAQRLAYPVSPHIIAVLRESRNVWFENNDEIEAGLDWGARKAALLRWVRLQMGRRLTKAERRCVELHYFAALNYSETAKKIGVRPCTVSRAIRRSLQKLRQAAKEDPSWRKHLR